MNRGSYELPLFKPPLCKVADAESDVSTTIACIELLYIVHNSTYMYVCMYMCVCVCMCARARACACACACVCVYSYGNITDLTY